MIGVFDMPEFTISMTKNEESIGIAAQVQGSLPSLSCIVPKQIGHGHDKPCKRSVMQESHSK